MIRSIVLIGAAVLACSAPVTSATTATPGGRPRVTSIVAVGDATGSEDRLPYPRLL